MIEVQNLNYFYPTKQALTDVSVSIERGSITALVGPNGAGKSTLFRNIAGLTSPFTGEINLAGVNVLKDPRSSHQHLGYLSDFFGVYEQLTVWQCLAYMAAAQRLEPRVIPKAVEKAAERLYIADRLQQKAGELSRGLTQRLGIAQALIHDPEVLLLDEPASGLDPEARQQLAQLFLELRDQGVTLLVSSHILSELDEYSTDMIIIREGRIVQQQNIQQTQERLRVIEVSVVNIEEIPKVEKILEKHQEVAKVKSKENTLTFEFTGSREDQYHLSQELQKKAKVYQFAERKVNLQQQYLDVVNQEEQS